MDRPGKTTIELDALDETRLIEVPVERPEIEPIDHDAHGGWSQDQDDLEFDHTGEEIHDDRTAVERALDDLGH